MLILNHVGYFMKKHINIWLHLGFWIFMWGLPLLVTLTNSPEITREWSFHILYTNFFTLLAFYYSYWFVAPYAIKLPSWFHGFLFFTGSGVILILIKFSGYWIMDPWLGDLLTKAKLLHWPKLVADALNTLLIMGIAILIKVTINLNKERQQKADLLVQQHSTELALLKAQVNPHFFFNTLNNIYSLVYKKSDDAPAALLKLSEIMRYMLYDSKSDTVPLEKELIHLENYLELEKLRLKDPSYISFKTKGDPAGIFVPPMLLLTFVENAFKHGKRRVEHPGIIIRIRIGMDELNFTVINYTQENQIANQQAEGIGLQNVTRRLELLYPDCHELEITHIKNQFKVSLTLKCLPYKEENNEN